MESGNDNTEQRMDSIEQALAKVSEQLQFLTTSIELLQVQSSQRERLEAEIPQVDGLSLEPISAKMKRELEVQYEEIEERLLKQLNEKVKVLNSADGFEQMSLNTWPSFDPRSYPEKFKAPEFEKYDGTGCLKVHARLYVWKMGRYVQNEQLMVQTFQYSLTGPALT